jgi:hypothetical protein
MTPEQAQAIAGLKREIELTSCATTRRLLKEEPDGLDRVKKIVQDLKDFSWWTARRHGRWQTSTSA